MQRVEQLAALDTRSAWAELLAAQATWAASAGTPTPDHASRRRAAPKRVDRTTADAGRRCRGSAPAMSRRWWLSTSGAASAAMPILIAAFLVGGCAVDTENGSPPAESRAVQVGPENVVTVKRDRIVSG